MALFLKIAANVCFWALLIWAFRSGQWGWAILILLGIALGIVVFMKAWDPDALPAVSNVVTVNTPVRESVSIRGSLDDVWAAALEDNPHGRRRFSINPARRLLRLRGGDTLSVIQRGGACELSLTMYPSSGGWSDGSFGYTLRPGMRASLEAIKRRAES